MQISICHKPSTISFEHIINSISIERLLNQHDTYKSYAKYWMENLIKLLINYSNDLFSAFSILVKRLKINSKKSFLRDRYFSRVNIKKIRIAKIHYIFSYESTKYSMKRENKISYFEEYNR